ncbi:hypothetical protein GLGCALEP_04266 [Pseudomonas sp. MM221]|nr:hypothetical protein DBADOPDK_04158 [Pseudomonas sp. MM223]CAI3807003.1 hypothetical protein GLGCALEP_04266 [Pseudomonas sp. MM221]
MIYYRDLQTNEVFAYSEADVEGGLVKEGLSPMTADEVRAHLNPVATWWTDGASMIKAAYGADGWHAASAEEVASFLPGILLDEAQTESARLRKIADETIAPLQDAVELDEATEAEAALLKEWKRYRVALSRLPEQEGYPSDIDWPAPPA